MSQAQQNDLTPELSDILSFANGHRHFMIDLPLFYFHNKTWPLITLKTFYKYNYVFLLGDYLIRTEKFRF